MPDKVQSAGTFKTVTLNVKSNPEMPQEKVAHDVRRASHQGSLIGWNEIGPKRYFEAIKSLGPDWSHYTPHDGGLRIPNPISWKNTVWKKEDAGFLRTHHGKAKVSPNRYVTWVKLKQRATGQEVVRINTHLVSGAWSRERPTTGWRREHWNEHMEKLQGLVQRFERQGLNVVIGGDFNRDSYRVLGGQVKYDNDLFVGTHGKSTYDYLMHTPGGSLKALGAHVQDGYASDHDAVIGRYSLGGGSPAPQPPPKHAVSFTAATVNDDFVTRKSNLPHVKADVVLVQEAKNENVRKLLSGTGVGVHQNTRRDDRQGTAVVWSRKVAKAVDGGYALGVRPHGHAMLNRWINWEDVVIDGTKVRMVSVHRPPARFKALWPLFDRNLAHFVQHSRLPIVVGMDANQVNPRALAGATGLTWHAPPGSIDGFLVSPGIQVDDLHRLPKDTSDHHPVVARFTLRRRS